MPSLAQVVNGYRLLPRKEFSLGIRRWLRSDPQLVHLVANSGGESYVTRVLLRVLDESICQMSLDRTCQQNIDKRYFQTTLKMYNALGERLNDYLHDLVDIMSELSGDGGPGDTCCGGDGGSDGEGSSDRSVNLP
jgi:hypothetical protein